jgi:hypothetical protein
MLRQRELGPRLHAVPCLYSNVTETSKAQLRRSYSTAWSKPSQWHRFTNTSTGTAPSTSVAKHRSISQVEDSGNRMSNINIGIFVPNPSPSSSTYALYTRFLGLKKHMEITRRSQLWELHRPYLIRMGLGDVEVDGRVSRKCIASGRL